MTSTNAAATPANGTVPHKTPTTAATVKKRRQHKGGAGALKGRNRSTWPRDIKLQAVEAMERGERAVEIAARLGMHASLIYLWARNKRLVGDVEDKHQQRVKDAEKFKASMNPRTARRSNAPVEASAFMVSCRRNGVVQQQGFPTQQDALDHYVALSTQPGVAGLSLWRGLKVDVMVRAEVRE
jgi:transposase-like protein